MKPFALAVLLSFSAACAPGDAPASPGTESFADMPNPASVFCEDQGGMLEIRTGADGGQTGACIFADGSECEEWAYFRGECTPGESAPPPVAPTVAPQPMQLQIFVPEDGGIVTAQQQRVAGVASPAAVVTVNEELLIAADDGSFETTIALEEGPNLIEVVASNASGTEAFVTLTVIFEP
jgi:putative hemolysin